MWHIYLIPIKNYNTDKIHEMTNATTACYSGFAPSVWCEKYTKNNFIVINMHPKGAVMNSSTQLYVVTFWVFFCKHLQAFFCFLEMLGHGCKQTISWKLLLGMQSAAAPPGGQSEVLTETSTCYMTEHTGEREYWQLYNTVLQYFTYYNCAQQFSQRSLVGPTVYVSHHISTVRLSRPHPQKHGGWDSHLKPYFLPQLCWN